MDAVWYGCIPVILSDDYQLPLEGILRWSDFSVRIAEADMAATPEILAAVTDSSRVAMRQALAVAAPLLTWHRPSQHGDAFEGVMLQLWQRRHVTRYRRLTPEARQQ